MSLITPTVGRKVWYRPTAFDQTGPGAMVVSHGQPLDATVLAVWGDRCVNLLVLDIVGKPFTKTSTTLIQDGDAKPTTPDGKDAGGYAEWMPYQQGQAKKEAA
jgi:hypothetical protein